MPSPNFGYSFSPTQENAQLARTGQVAGAAPQGAIKTLNFRLPAQVGRASARSISPLVGQQSAGSGFGGAVLQSVLRTVLGVEAAAALMGHSGNGGGIGGEDRRTSRDAGSDIFRALSGGQSPSSASPFTAAPPLQTPDPVFVPGQETGEGPASPPYQPPGDWIDPRPSAPDPAPTMSSPTFTSPWEAPGRNPHMAEKYGYLGPQEYV